MTVFLVVLSKFTMSPTVRQKVRLTIHKQQITYNIFLYIYFLEIVIFVNMQKISTEKGVTTTKVILIYDLKLLTWYIPNKDTTCCELHTYTFKAMTSHIIHYHALHLEKYKNLEKHINTFVYLKVYHKNLFFFRNKIIYFLFRKVE